MKPFTGLMNLLWLIGIIIMAISGESLGNRFGVTWEFAGFAFGILLAGVGSIFPLMKRIAELERKVFDLISAKSVQ